MGIGTTNPLQRLQVGTANTLGVSIDGKVFVVTDNGDVGIGTTRPTSKLHVVGNTLIVGITTVGFITATNLNVSGVGTFLSSGLKVRNPANTFQYDITGGAIAADRILNLPVITGTDTLAVLGLSQTFSAAQTFSSTLTHSATTANFTATSYTTGTVTIGGALQTGAITVGQATTSQTLNLATGVSLASTTKTINFGTGGLSGSFTQINIGSTAGVGTITINSGTNLGINSTTPTSKLDVVGDAKITGVVTATTFNGQINAGVSTLGLSIATNLTSQTINVSGISTFNADVLIPTSSSKVGIGTTNPLQRLQVGTANTLGVSIDGKVFVVTDNGDVGIGTTRPTSKLHVVGDVLVTGVTTFGNSILPSVDNSYDVGSPTKRWGNFYVNSITGTLAGGAATVAVISDTQNATRYLTFFDGTSGIGSLRANTNLTYNPGAATLSLQNGPLLIGSGTSTGTSLQTLQVTGGAYISTNTGIGTTSPTSRLHVVGDVLVIGVTTSNGYNATTGNDYKINGTSVLTSTTLGSGVVNSSLTSVGTLTNLSVGNINSTGILTATRGNFSGIVTSSGAVISGVTTSNGYNATTGNDYKINGTSVLTSTTLGSGVINSSLTSVGTLTKLDVGNINSTGIITATSGNFSGIVTSSAAIISGVTTSNGYNATTGNDYKINGTSVLTSTTLGSAVVNSSLTSVGTLTNLSVGNINSTGILTATRGNFSGIVTSSGAVISGVTTSNGYNATTGNDYKINNTSVLTSTTLGSGVVNSSLTSVGTLTNLSVGNINSTGILTATGGIRGIGIQSGGLSVAVGIITALNFIGLGNTFNYNSTTGKVDISIGGGNWSYTNSSNLSGSIYRLSNVGIGTTNPTQALDVNGSALIGTDLFVGSDSPLVIANGNTHEIYKSNGQIRLTGGGSQPTRNNILLTNSGGLIIDGGSGETAGVELKGGGGPVKVTQGNLLVGTSSSTGTTSQLLQVASGAYVSGNLGIGTTNPVTKLQVERYGVSTGFGTFSASAGIATDIDTFTIATTDFETAEYTLHFTNGSNIQAQKVLVMQNGTTAYSQEYAVMSEPNLIVSIGATISAGVCKLTATPEVGISGLTTYRYTRQTML